MTSSTQTSIAIPTRGDRLPLFTGQTPDGTTLRLRDFYMRRNLALVFSDSPEYTATRDLLRGLAEQREAVRAEAGEALAVISGDAERVRQLVAELSLSFPVVIDPDNAIHARYGLLDASGNLRAAIFLADRFGTIFETSVETEDGQIMAAGEVPGWLEFIACRCT